MFSIFFVLSLFFRIKNNINLVCIHYKVILIVILITLFTSFKKKSFRSLNSYNSYELSLLDSL